MGIDCLGNALAVLCHILNTTGEGHIQTGRVILLPVEFLRIPSSSRQW